MSMRGMKGLILMFALMVCPLLIGSAQAQDTPEEPIKGSIQVSEGDDFESLAKITFEEARTTALVEVPGATLSEGELDEEDGYLVYEFEFEQDGQEVEVVIDAGNGAVLQVEREEADDDD